MINIIITVDYEIFGNGKGNVKKHILNPTTRLLNISDKHNVPLSIMFEIYEYLAFEKYNKELEIDFGYSPVKEIKKQLQTAYKNGHDVQLHIHPQFTEMEYKQKNFLLKNPTLSVLDLKKEEVYKLIKNGKDKIESVLNFSDYKCLALRLSNMPWIEAPKNMLSSMDKLGLKIHSLSASCEMKNKLGYWKLYDSQSYEIPIHTVPMKIYKLFNLRNIFTLLYIWRYSPPKKSFGKTERDIEKKKLKKGYYCSKWDFSKLSFKDMIEYLEFAIKKFDYKNHEIPLIMIGHSKDFFNDKNFEKFLEITKEMYIDKGIARFTTIRNYVDRYMTTGE